MTRNILSPPLDTHEGYHMLHYAELAHAAASSSFDRAHESLELFGPAVEVRIASCPDESASCPQLDALVGHVIVVLKEAVPVGALVRGTEP